MSNRESVDAPAGKEEEAAASQSLIRRLLFSATKEEVQPTVSVESAPSPRDNDASNEVNSDDHSAHHSNFASPVIARPPTPVNVVEASSAEGDVSSINGGRDRDINDQTATREQLEHLLATHNDFLASYIDTPGVSPIVVEKLFKSITKLNAQLSAIDSVAVPVGATPAPASGIGSVQDGSPTDGVPDLVESTSIQLPVEQPRVEVASTPTQLDVQQPPAPPAPTPRVVGLEPDGCFDDGSVSVAPNARGVLEPEESFVESPIASRRNNVSFEEEKSEVLIADDTELKVDDVELSPLFEEEVTPMPTLQGLTLGDGVAQGLTFSATPVEVTAVASTNVVMSGTERLALVDPKHKNFVKNQELVTTPPSKTKFGMHSALGAGKQEKEDGGNLGNLESVADNITENIDKVKKLKEHLQSYSLLVIFFIPQLVASVFSSAVTSSSDRVKALLPDQVLSAGISGSLRNFFEQWATLSYQEVLFWQCFINLNGFISAEYRQASSLVMTILQKCVTGNLADAVNKSMSKLHEWQRGGIIYWFYLTKQVFYLPDASVSTFQSFVRDRWQSQGPSLYKENISTCTKTLEAVLQLLWQNRRLPHAILQEVLTGFTKAANSEFRAFAMQKLQNYLASKFTNAMEPGTEENSDDSTLMETVKGHFADLEFFFQDLYHRGRIKDKKDLRINKFGSNYSGCDRCGSLEHQVRDCPEPATPENLAIEKKNREARQKRRSGTGEKKIDTTPKRDYNHNHPTIVGSGSTAKAHMFCKHCNAFVSDHSTNYHAKWKKAGGEGHFNLCQACPNHPLIALNAKIRADSSSDTTPSDTTPSPPKATSASGAKARMSALVRKAICETTEDEVMDALSDIQTELQNFQ